MSQSIFCCCRFQMYLPRSVAFLYRSFLKRAHDFCIGNVKTNVRKRFLFYIDHHFLKSNPLHKIFNNSSLSMSYSCMSSKKPPEKWKSDFNCRKKNFCLMDGNCNESNTIYQGEVTTSKFRETYIRLCDTKLK